VISQQLQQYDGRLAVCPPKTPHSVRVIALDRTTADGTVRPRKNIRALLMRVRAFYLDIQQWALEDPHPRPRQHPANRVRRAHRAGPAPLRKAATIYQAAIDDLTQRAGIAA
jgi:hypothetical protein